MTTLADVADQLKAARHAAGVSQTELARRAGETAFVERGDEDLHCIDTVHDSSRNGMPTKVAAIIPHSTVRRKSVCQISGIRSDVETA